MSSFQLPPEICDAHHHLWNPVSNDPDIGYKWLKDIGAPKPFGDPTPIQRDYLLPELFSDVAPTTLRASVHLQADGAIPDPVAETRWIQQQADLHGHQMAIVGFVDLSQPDAAAVIDAHQKSPVFRGVRQILSRLDDAPQISFAGEHFVKNPRWRDQFQLLTDAGLRFDLQCYPEQMPDVAEFLSHHPQVPVVIDHAGSPYNQSPAGLMALNDGLAALAVLPQVSIKWCGLGMFDPHWTRVSVQPVWDCIRENFAIDRILFASNFPVDKLMKSYRFLLEVAAMLVAGEVPADQQKFFAGNARRFYDI